MSDKINVKDITNYSYKGIETCYVINCDNYAEWWILDDAFGICYECYKGLEKDGKEK